MEINQLIAAKIRERRLHKNLTLESVAHDLGISKAAMSQLENGHRKITARKIFLLAKILDVPVSFFFEGIAL